MKHIIEPESLAETVCASDSTEEFESVEYPQYQANSSVNNMTYMRQIEIIRENKLLMLSLKDIYDT